MNIDNAQKVVNMMVDLATTDQKLRNKDGADGIREIRDRIKELAKALKFSEEDLKTL